MRQSQEIALRCAASLPSDLLAGNWRDLRRERYADRFGWGTQKHCKMLTHKLMDQLDACKNDSARRLLLGVSERFAKPQTFKPVGNSRAVAARVAA